MYVYTWAGVQKTIEKDVDKEDKRVGSQIDADAYASRFRPILGLTARQNTIRSSRRFDGLSGGCPRETRPTPDTISGVPAGSTVVCLCLGEIRTDENGSLRTPEQASQWRLVPIRKRNTLR